MKKLILSLIVILLFNSCSTKYIYTCPKLKLYDKNITIHINENGGLDKENTIKLITYCKQVKLYYKTIITKYNSKFTKVK